MRHTLLTFIIACLALGASAQGTPETTYARKGQNVTLDLHWTSDNYGTVQWQQSADGGQTWTDIAGAKTPVYTYKAENSRLVRARIEGDLSCPPVCMERQINVMELSAEVDAIYHDHADVTVTCTGLPAELVADYGYCFSLSGLSRSYTMMPLHVIGTQLPAEPFSMTCTGLRPAQSYNIRAFVRLTDGTVIYGPGKLAKTTDGIEWSSEDWLIETNRIQAHFVCPEGTRNVVYRFGETPETLQEYGTTAKEHGIVAGAIVSGLKPGTTYYASVTATVGDEEMTISREVRTLPDYSNVPTDDTVVPVGHKIDWGDRTLHRISLPGDTYQVEYPRIVRAADGSLILTYHGGTQDHWQNSYIRRSYDEGQTWTDQQTLFSASNSFYGSHYYRICNPQVTLLENGWLILSVCANANPETNYNCKVLASISKDNGITWSDPVVVCRGRTWEPHVLQLPDGDLELLVSSEAWWWDNQRGNLFQEIISSRSTDNGETWTASKRACYLPGYRDGMPVPILMQGGKGVLFSIESVGSGLAPSFVHRDLDKEWDTADWDRKDDPDRWLTNLNGSAGAPYAIQLTTGEIVVTAHTNQAGSVWQTNRPQVALTDNTGHNPKFKTLPASQTGVLGTGDGAYYNSLWQKDDDTIWLIVTHSVYDGATRVRSSIEYMEGKIVPVE